MRYIKEFWMILISYNKKSKKMTKNWLIALLVLNAIAFISSLLVNNIVACIWIIITTMWQVRYYNVTR